MELNDFLTRNRISPDIWAKAAIEWTLLEAIAADHETQQESLRDTAELFARVVQRFPSVHSVRLRIKESDHLLEKIIRKRAEGLEKYANINEKNYYEIVTDLVGIRALHLFKDDCFSIDSELRSTWSPTEKPIAYLREGDPKDLTEKFRHQDFEVKSHPAGYRSVHYVCASQPLQRRVIVEIQVRTIFEEGWSEIDHRVRYPNFSDDKLVDYFLTIFNRLAGSADEMGTFVQGLTSALDASKLKLSESNQQKEQALSAMDKMLSDLEKMKKQDVETSKKLSELQREVSKLRNISSFDSLDNLRMANALSGFRDIDSKILAAQLGIGTSLAEQYRKSLGLDNLERDALLKGIQGNR